MQLITILLALLIVPPEAEGAVKKPEEREPVEQFRTELRAALAKLGADVKNGVAADQAVHKEVSRLVDKHLPKLRPEAGSKRYISADKTFVLVIGANGSNGKHAVAASAADNQAKIVVAVGGDGGPPQPGLNGGNGANAMAQAPNGIAVAFGGRGGAGGGIGGHGDATGIIGSVGVGGSGSGGFGKGNGIKNAKAIAEAIKGVKKK